MFLESSERTEAMRRRGSSPSTYFTNTAGFVQKHMSKDAMHWKREKGDCNVLAFQTEKSSYKWNRMLKNDCLFNFFVILQDKNNLKHISLSLIWPLKLPFLPNQCIAPAPHKPLYKWRYKHELLTHILPHSDFWPFPLKCLYLWPPLFILGTYFQPTSHILYSFLTNSSLWTQYPAHTSLSRPKYLTRSFLLDPTHSSQSA